MRLSVVRNNLPGPIFLADLETVSGRNASVDPEGQARYVSYPTLAGIEAVLADSTTGVGATIVGSGAPNLQIVAATDDVLRLKTSAAASFVNYTIAPATYASLDALIVAINTALTGSGIRAFKAGTVLVLESQTFGVNSYLQIDNAAGGSTANSGLGLANGATRNMPAASVFLTGAGFPGGPITVNQATLEALGAGNNSRALEPHYDAGLTRGGPALANYLAPQYADTDVAVDSFLVGMISQFRSSSYNPNPGRDVPGPGAAIDVVENDGVTAYETAHTLPSISSATLGSPSTGAVTIAGTGLGGERGNVIVKFTGVGAKKLTAKQILNAGGSLSETAIVVPASLIPGVATTTTSVQIQVRQLPLSDVQVLA